MLTKELLDQSLEVLERSICFPPPTIKSIVSTWLFMEDNPHELSLVKKLIAREGLFYLFFQPPYHLPGEMTISK